jgi:hypothetical protein
VKLAGFAARTVPSAFSEILGGLDNVGRGGGDNAHSMGRRVKAEIEHLPATLAAASELDLGPLQVCLDRAAGRPTVFVGSGGALAAARLAADLFRTSGLGVSWIQTPLELLVGSSPGTQAGFVFTASGRHPDARAAIRHLAVESDPCAVITTNPSPQLERLCERLGVPVVHLENPAGKDGFLAVNSLVVMAVAATRALTGKDTPTRFPSLSAAYEPPSRLDEIVVLFPPGLAAVATDLEARLTETGLAAVQVVDYRNFAHGRHVGLARRAARSSVVALIDASCHRLAEQTLELLPPEIPQLRLESELGPPWDAVDLLLASIRITAMIGEAAGVDTGRPHVPPFGRRLYRMRTALDNVAAGPAPPTPIRLKLRELGLIAQSSVASREYETAYKDWLVKLRRASFAAIALDYDGTVVSTAGRFDLPTHDVRGELNRLLDSGTTLGFASGRGDSLVQDLREWVPRSRWRQVHLGLYNGAVLMRLDEELPPRRDRDPSFAEVDRRLATLPMYSELALSDRHYQLQITLLDARQHSIPAIAGIIEGALRRPPQLPLGVMMSAHSIDVVPAASTKVTLLDHVAAVGGAGALAIGDQGQLGGNDFAFLAAQELTLSVDRCSPDPTRCWRLIAPHSGPFALRRFLAALDPTPRGLRFRWRTS